jgi:hypothetical protein
MPTRKHKFRHMSSTGLWRGVGPCCESEFMILMPWCISLNFCVARRIETTTRRRTKPFAPRKLFVCATPSFATAEPVARTTSMALGSFSQSSNAKIMAPRAQIQPCRRSTLSRSLNARRRGEGTILPHGKRTAFRAISGIFTPLPNRFSSRFASLLNSNDACNRWPSAKLAVRAPREAGWLLGFRERVIDRRRSFTFAKIRPSGDTLNCGISSSARIYIGISQIPATNSLYPQRANATTSRRGYLESLLDNVGLSCDREICDAGIGRELPAAGARKRAGLTFVRSCLQMFGHVANGSLRRRQRLFHQKSGEHRGGSFVEPLFEKSVDFFFQIRSMVQSGKFKGLKGRDGGLLKILPRGADTSGIHLGSPKVGAAAIHVYRRANSYVYT